MGDNSNKGKKSKEDLKVEPPSAVATGLSDEKKKSENVNVLLAKYKGGYSPEDIADLISDAEKTIREFFGAVTKRVSYFLNSELPQLKELSKDEFTKINAALLEYKAQLEKISQEKIKRVTDIKSKLHTRIMTAEEVKGFVRYFDEKMAEVRKMTQNIIVMLRENKVADKFATELQTVVTNYSKRVTTAMEELFTALKATAENISKTVSDNSSTSEEQKISTTSELQKTPMLNKVFERMGGSSSSANDSGKPRDVPLMPAAMKSKLRALNLSKHFNSETMYGRANIAKVTYLGAFIYFLYWKFKKSKN